MELTHTFTVPLGVQDTYELLLDVRRLAPCLPGATVDSVEDDDITGSVKVKVGSIGLAYKGRARFVEKDPVGHRLVVDGRGSAGANGAALARVTATLASQGEAATRVDVHTDLAFTGRPAQFGHGVIVGVSNHMRDEFVANLHDDLQRSVADDAVPDARDDTVAVAPTPPRQVDPIDVIAAAGPAAVRTSMPLAPAAATGALLALVWLVSRRRRVVS